MNLLWDIQTYANVHLDEHDHLSKRGGEPRMCYKS